MAKDVNIKIKSDSKEAQSGIKQVTSELNKLSKGLKNNDVAKLSKSFVGVTGAIAGTVAAVKKVNAAVKETTELYRAQIKAETQLETAAKNNPYLNDSSVKALKDYASYLQSISIVGDEELLPLMAQLAAAGRTQEEIQKIMSAALDVSASGMMSLDSAVTALNKTYSGSVGLLGNQINGLKGLTAEQLKSGEAVKVVAEQYKGMSEETTKATGSSEQLKNAVGDLKEVMGETFEEGLSPMRQYFTELILSYVEARKQAKMLKEAQKNGATDVQSAKLLLDTEKERLRLLEAQPKQRITSTRGDVRYVSDKKAAEDLEKQRQKVKDLETSYNDLVEAEKKEQEEAKRQLELIQAEAAAQAKLKKQQEKELEAKNKRQNAIDAYNKSTSDYVKSAEIQARLQGEEIDKQDILNNKISSYVDLVLQLADGENDPFAQEKLKEIEEYAKGIENITNHFEEFRNALNDLNDYLSQAMQITTDASNLFLDSISEQTSDQLTELSKQYTDGLISYEEYCKRKKEISKKAAQEEYKIKMWEWSSSLLTATANIAEGVSKAIAQGGVAGIITGALVAASGAIQIANLVANKPRPPQFANGGYVPGTSYSGDNVPIMANSGELILNSKEQAVLRQFMGNKGSSGAVINMPVNIENNAGVNVQAQMDKNGLRVVIDEMVNASMQEGRYTQSMQIAQSKANGISYF